MEAKTDKLHPSAPLLENIDLEKRLEKKINDVNSFNNHINNIKEMITYFKDKNNKSKKRYKNYKTITTILKSFDTFVIITTTSSSIALSLTGIGLIAIPISTATACGLSIGNEVLYEIIKNKYNKYKKLYVQSMYYDIGAYDMQYDEFKQMCHKGWDEKFNYLCIDLSKNKNEGKYRIFNESKNTYIECICETEAF